MSLSQLYCCNCGSYEHGFKQCPEPVISYGIIAIKFNNDIDYDIIDKINNNIELENNGIKCFSNDDVKLFSLLNSSCNFLLIKRRHTLGFVEFVRGRYKQNNIQSITHLFNQMIKEELDLISLQNFDLLWKALWSDDVSLPVHEIEFEKAKNKFQVLKDSKICSLDNLIKNAHTEWKTAEWCFPKGRRNDKESDLECAIREFGEETGLNPSQFTIINTKPLNENFIGTNGTNYRHTYFIALVNKDTEIDHKQISKGEIGDIGFYKFNEALSLFRPYHIERKKLLTLVYMSIINTIIKLYK